ncbi:MAG: NAD(+) diphosphatase [Lachnospiraceae bacterium]|nr:NAD(+) diphosphatase [Lachnospiraceae bacterium]
MIQDIYPSRLKNEYVNKTITDDDCVMIFNSEGKMLLGKKEDKVIFPKGKGSKGRTVYLFSLDETAFFLDLEGAKEPGNGFDYYSVREVRDLFEGKEVFAVFTGYHLWKWYSDNIFCGKCTDKLIPDEKERALRCPKCGNVIYPRINPAVIVGVTNGDSLLITKYKRGFAHNALVAGFTEIGETLEETVAREVMEETGVKVKNIRYYKSQPWGMAQDILMGFYCDVDGDPTIKMDESELKYAEWVKREEIVLQPNNLSLTNEMMRMFKENAL